MTPVPMVMTPVPRVTVMALVLMVTAMGPVPTVTDGSGPHGDSSHAHGDGSGPMVTVMLTLTGPLRDGGCTMVTQLVTALILPATVALTVI